jgi:hypothetical protein
MLTTEWIARLLTLSQALVKRGHPIAQGNSGFCVYCAASRKDITGPIRHFEDCPWDALRIELHLEVEDDA